jgi:predicted protein tyrosine phosphatase
MIASLFAIEGPWRGILAIAPAPPPGRHLEKALMRWHRLGITTIVSLMLPGERPGWEQEEALCHDLGIIFISIPIRDHSIPEADEMENIVTQLEQIEKRLEAGERVAAHCFGGIGRSGMATIALLMIAGIALPEAIQRVTMARGLRCPETDEQLEWLASFDRFRRLSYT